MNFWSKNYHIPKFAVQKWVRPIKNGVIALANAAKLTTGIVTFAIFCDHAATENDKNHLHGAMRANCGAMRGSENENLAIQLKIQSVINANHEHINFIN